MTITLTTGPLILIVGSVFLFLLSTFLCHQQGLFDGADTFGIGTAVILLLYAVLWAVPSALSWAIWATWIR